VTAYAALSRLRIAGALHRGGFARSVARTAGFNFTTMAVGGLGGIIIARAVGPTVCGEYAAVMAWMGVLLAVSGMGQSTALVYYVASEPLRARDYLATSRAMTMATGLIALVAGVLLAPVLGRNLPSVTTGYRIAFGMLIVVLVGQSFTASLQARDLFRWNVVRLIQPAFGLIAIVVLWQLRRLTLDLALTVIAVTMLLQLVWAYHNCRHTGLASGRVRVELIRPLSRYGIAQIAASAPAILNAQLD
jgi:O-antigen/teichoic acid export membrane protein